MAADEKKKSSRWGRGAIVVGVALVILMLWCRFCECDRCAGDGTPPVATLPDAPAEPIARDVAEADSAWGAGGPVSEGAVADARASEDAAPGETAPVPVTALAEPAVVTPPPVASAPAARKLRKPIASKRATDVPVGAGVLGATSVPGTDEAGASAARAAEEAAAPDVGSGPAALAAGLAVGPARQRFSNPADVGFSPIGLAARPGLDSANDSLRILNPCDTAASGCQRSFVQPAAPNNAPVPGPPLPF